MSEFQAKPIERISLNQYIVDSIIDAVRKGELHLGDKLPSEEQLCKQFGVGRHVVREGLRRLQEMSIVQTETGKGTFICPTPPDTLGPQASALLLLGKVDDKSLLDFRIAIESFAAYFAAERATKANCAKVCEYLVRMKNAKDSPESSEEFLAANYEFHKEIVRLSGNSLYIVLYNTMNDLLSQLVTEYPYSAESTISSFEEHTHIYQAIVDGDKDAAFMSERDHLMRLRNRRYGARIRDDI